MIYDPKAAPAGARFPGYIYPKTQGDGRAQPPESPDAVDQYRLLPSPPPTGGERWSTIALVSWCQAGAKTP
jgi:hypothetical protein